jgi:hypothetical protein
MGDDRKPLPRDVQLALGRKLRDAYRATMDRLPLDLVGLAHRVKAPADFQKRPDIPPPLDALRTADSDVLDPETIRILIDAFNRAWEDLQILHGNPATEEALALTLIVLVKEGERNPAQLATKAVLKMIQRRS